MATAQRITYGWQDGGNPYVEIPADVYHAECAPRVAWLTETADASIAAKIDGRGHKNCMGCFGPLTEPPALNTDTEG